ncbi:hypothetical protein [Dyadobacter aurulentus]|uniref:hypothetical protein n=1 Tax=Dyadobacter sp. UC 10 TaxID=2605428 RepID=UPI0011F37E0C|nr:hypothetical protein [Dyadobacter sp. UC 10]KAA0989336.1 hypothetical protein FXO21_03765 [Dyadobacter sp. UC 10]
MHTIEIEITDKKAMKLLMDMEEMHLIKVINKKLNISSLRSKIKAPMILLLIQLSISVSCID